MDDKIHILIADDQAVSREGFQRIFEREADIEVDGIVEAAPEILLQVRKKIPDVVLVDLKWYHDDQAMTAVITQLRNEYPRICIIGITVYDHLLQQAKIAGANWAVSKDISKDELVRLIRSAYAASMQDYYARTMTERLSQTELVDLRRRLLALFSADELRTLCFDIGVDYESLPAEGKDGKARELVAHLERVKRIPELIAACRDVRPNSF